MKYLELFTGISGFSKGIERAYEETSFKGRVSQTPHTGPSEPVSGSGNEWRRGNIEPPVRDGESADHEYAHISTGPEPEERSQGRIRSADKRRVLLHAGNRSAPLCIGFSEIDPVASGILKYHYPDVRNYGDARNIIPGELPDFDFLCAGFPCQSFSIAGKRQGFDDTRGTLFFEIARILSHKRPAHFLLENVRGLVSHDDGKTLQTILGVLSDLDYFVEVFVLNSKDFGVPQNRERVFFVGHSSRECGREILSFGDGDQEIISQEYERALSGTISTKNQSPQCQFDGSTTLIYGKDGQQKKRDFASCLTGGAHSGGNHSDMDLIQVGTMRTHKDGEGFRAMKENISPALNARARQDGSQQTIIQINPSTESGGKQPYQQNRVYDPEGIAPASAANLSSGSIAVPVLTPDRPTKRQNGRRFKDDGEDAFNGSRIRRLTPVECMRLQGFEDSHCDFGTFQNKKGECHVREISDTGKYKCAGNAVTTNVIEAIVTRMIEIGCLDHHGLIPVQE